MHPFDLAIKLLFIPIGENLEILNECLSRFQLIPYIFQSLRSDPKKRIDFDSWKNVLTTAGCWYTVHITQYIARHTLQLTVTISFYTM